MRRRTGALLAVLGLVLVSCGGTPEQSGDLDTTIAVHGDWTIEVYNADGSLDRRHEFSNELAGGDFLAAILSKQSRVWYYSIQIGRLNDGDLLPCVDSDTPIPCLIREPIAGGAFNPVVSDNLQVTTGGTDGDQLVFSGSHTASRDGFVTAVGTIAATCPIDQSPPCAGLGVSVFTRKDFESGEAISVTAGQVMNVEVVVSFGSG